jgi:hypothetical protein
MDRLTIERTRSRQRTHRILIGVILATLPCYACGIILLVGFAPARARQDILTLTVPSTATITGTPTSTTTPTLTLTPGGPTVTLPYTPTQFIPASREPSPTPTATPTLTVAPTLTLEPTLTGVPTPTATPTPTVTTGPTSTSTEGPSPTPSATQEPTATETEAPDLTATVNAALTQASLDLTATAEAGGGR